MMENMCTELQKVTEKRGRSAQAAAWSSVRDRRLGGRVPLGTGLCPCMCGVLQAGKACSDLC